MAPRPQQKKRRPRRRPGFAGARDQTQCRFCRGGITYIDYKDIDTLQKLLPLKKRYHLSSQHVNREDALTTPPGTRFALDFQF